jgi:GTP-binding protein HflX
MVESRCDARLRSTSRDTTVRQLVPETWPRILISARKAADVALLHGHIEAFFERNMSEEEFVIPYDAQGQVALLHERRRVFEERYEEDGAHIRVRAPDELLEGLRQQIRSGD